MTTVSRYNQQPVFLPDGKSILFLAGTERNASSRYIFSLWKVELDGSKPIRIAESKLFTDPLHWPTPSDSVQPAAPALSNGVAPCLAPHLLIDPRSLTEFLDECRSLVRRRTVPHDQRQRARLVLLLHESPDLSNVAAGALVELHANSVHRWRHRWACGNFSLADKAGRGRKPAFSPRDRAIVKAIACEAVCQTKLPLSRLSTSDLADRTSMALGRSISPSTVWRILDTDAIKPWRYQYWIFPRDPKFSEKAGRSWTCTLAPGRANRWAVGTTSSARMRRQASRPESDVTRLCRRVRDAPCEWNMSMSAAAPCSTWPPGTFAAVGSWVDARTRLESTRSADWSIR